MASKAGSAVHTAPALDEELAEALGIARRHPPPQFFTIRTVHPREHARAAFRKWPLIPSSKKANSCGVIGQARMGALFMPQGHQRIDRRRAAGRQSTGDGADEKEDCHCRADDKRVGGLDAE